MGKLRQLLKVSALIMVMLLLLSGTGSAAGLLKANDKTPDVTADDSSGHENRVSASFANSTVYLESDAPDEFFFQYGTGAAITLNYSVHSALDADEYRLTCTDESITLLSPAEYSIDPSGSYRLEFRAPENGEGKIVLTLTAFRNGEALGEEVHSYLYWSSCDCGVFLSEYSEPLPELAMAKAQYDASEITSGDSRLNVLILKKRH